MTRLSWWFVERLSRLLQADEREAALGDFVESGLIGWRALRDLLGLIAKRQAALWADRRPWLALVFLVAPVGYLLSQTSLRLSVSLNRHFWIKWNNGERYLTGLTAGEEIFVLACQCMALVLWTWTSGFVLGSLARKTVWVHGALFSLGWLIFGVGLVFRAALHPHAAFPPFVQILHAVLLLLPSVVFLLPSVSGARRGLRIGTLEARHAILVAVAAATITGLTIWTGTWREAALERWSEGAYHAKAIDWQKLLSQYAVVSWPIFYILATAGSLRKRESIGETTSI